MQACIRREAAQSTSIKRKSKGLAELSTPAVPRTSSLVKRCSMEGILLEGSQCKPAKLAGQLLACVSSEHCQVDRMLACVRTWHGHCKSMIPGTAPGMAERKLQHITELELGGCAPRGAHIQHMHPQQHAIHVWDCKETPAMATPDHAPLKPDKLVICIQSYT